MDLAALESNRTKGQGFESSMSSSDRMVKQPSKAGVLELSAWLIGLWWAWEDCCLLA